ncbi:hypothetical protein Bsp3421_000851 [Burkholderia sp. FERM BP-3421]|jgi:hypothetical protein|uniref:hypothetical protein n=1 Tax=Burkholderia sp. FERM BP-3421 TaxID=1494466 RepID=UPI002361ADB7|nr:hypothetical protein [Burkholderia sp. FERM BP-3421]WDD90963.1 hypothetical protein Bsp3421_000851 [Burkholderia sp. FERM BP-3421]
MCKDAFQPAWRALLITAMAAGVALATGCSKRDENSESSSAQGPAAMAPGSAAAPADNGAAASLPGGASAPAASSDAGASGG